jgi:hypothetical protein
MGVPSIDPFHPLDRGNRQIHGIAGSGQQSRAEFMAVPRGIIRALVAACGNSLRRRHWAIAGKPTSGDAVGCAPSYADDPKVWSGRARAFQRGSGKPSEA